MSEAQRNERPLERVVSVRNFHLVTYGLGDAYCREKFTPIKNRKHILILAALSGRRVATELAAQTTRQCSGLELTAFS
mgnify:CR=1 FL=1